MLLYISVGCFFLDAVVPRTRRSPTSAATSGRGRGAERLAVAAVPVGRRFSDAALPGVAGRSPGWRRRCAKVGLPEMSTRLGVVGVASSSSLHPTRRTLEAARHWHGGRLRASPTSAPASTAPPAASARQPRSAFPPGLFGVLPDRRFSRVTSAASRRPGRSLQLPQPKPETTSLGDAAASVVVVRQGRAHGHADVKEAENRFVIRLPGNSMKIC